MKIKEVGEWNPGPFCIYISVLGASEMGELDFDRGPLVDDSKSE